MPLPFGLKAPSRGTVIFGTVVASISGGIYASNYYATQSRRRLFDQVSWLAERPCGVHELPRKVAIYITAPPGDSLEKSRAWFRDYVKPVLVAGAVDYEVKESGIAGQIEAAVCEEIVKRRRAAALVQSNDNHPEHSTQKAFAPMMTDVFKKQAEENQVDGMLAIGRNTWKEVLNGLSKGCTSSLEQEPESLPEASETPESSDTSAPSDAVAEIVQKDEQDQTLMLKDELAENMQPFNIHDDVEAGALQNGNDDFSLPPSFPPLVYIPHENIIGWTNIPYRLYMWFADYKRIEYVGNYVVAAVLNQTRSLESEDIDMGAQEKVYWIGDDAKQAVEEDTPITVDERIQSQLRTFVLPSP